MQDINPPQLSAISDTLINCYEPSVTLWASSTTDSELSYSWVDDSGSPIASSAEVAVSEAGTFELILRDEENGCESNLDGRRYWQIR